MNITKVTSTTNTTACAKRIPKYLVIHYTAGTSSTAGHAKSIAQYFAKASTKASADFIVDDGTVVQFNPDPTTRYTWAVGGSKYTSMTTSVGGKMYGIVKNANSIHIEMCSSKKNTKCLKATDTDWYISDKTIANTVELAKYLMDLYGISINNVYMHHHVTGKICPNPWCINEAALANWESFKNKLTKSSTSASETIEVNGYTLTRTAASKAASGTYTLTSDATLRKIPSAVGVKVISLAKGASVEYEGWYHGTWAFVGYNKTNGSYAAVGFIEAKNVKKA